jgi:hypothetical protein
MQAYPVMLSQSETNMKKSIQVCIIVILALALVFTAFTVTYTSADMAKVKNCPDVGWNGKGVDKCPSVKAEMPSLQEFAYSWFVNPPLISPCVGWNG